MTATIDNAASPLVAVVDRHAWYDPGIEREHLARADARVEVSWAGVADRPPEADRGRPPDEASARAISRITGAFVPPSVTTEDRVIAMAQAASGILVVRASISARVMDALPRLLVVGRYGIGIDNIDTAAAEERGIAVVYAPSYCAPEVADHAMAMLLAFARKLVPMNEAMLRGEWARDTAAPMRALYTQTLGLVGFGHTGRAVAKRAHAFGLTVLACDPLLTAADAQRNGVVRATFAEVLAQSDFVSLHVPLDATTRHLVGAAELARMKPSAILINTSRGPVIDEAAVAAALGQRRIAGAALDVYDVEPLPAGSPLHHAGNVLLTPHIAGISDEGQMRLRAIVATAMAEVLAGTGPAGPELFGPSTPAGIAKARARRASAPGRMNQATGT